MRPYVMSIAGLDPSGGAGILADTKTFEGIGVQGFGVCTALTYQRDDYLESIDWIAPEKILRQADILIQKFKVSYCKIGIMENMETLGMVLDYLFEKNIKVILDPVLSSSSGFEVHSDGNTFIPLLEKVFLITPNFPEMKAIFNGQVKGKAVQKALEKTHIFLKGGHNNKKRGTDYLFTKDAAFPYHPQKGEYFDKHGSGCILSSAIAAYLALGNDLKTACFKAKEYTSHILASNKGLLGYHNY